MDMSDGERLVSVILPTYNEAENISVLLPRLKSVLESTVGNEYEIVIVDDNSPDNTAALAIRRANELGMADNVKVLIREEKRGLATAVIDGIKKSSGKYIIVMDADLQHPPEKIKDIVTELIKGAEIVVASRYIEGGKDEGLNIFRKLVSRMASLMGKLLVPQIRPLSDPMSGFFGIDRKVIEGRINQMNPRGFKILLEIMVKGRYLKENVKEVPLVFDKRRYGKSKLGMMGIIEFLMHILSLNDYRILKFMGVGVTGIFINEGTLWLLHYILNLPVKIAGLISIEASIINNYTLNSIITFRKEKVKGGPLYRLGKYHIATAIGAVVNYTVLIILTHLFSIEPLAANMVGIMLGFLANYTFSEHYVWERVGSYE